MLPNIVRDVLQRRCSRLSRRCYETLTMAAVLGRNLEHTLLVTALDPRSEIDIIEDLEEAIQARVLQEMPAGYAFTHTLLREVIYGSMSARRAMLLHERAGLALERMLGARVDERAAELAHHFIHAGHDASSRAKALRYSREAGRHAARGSLHREALQHFSRACELVDSHGTVEPDSKLEVLEGRAEAEWALGLWLPLVETCERMLALTNEPLQRARAMGWIGHAQQRTGNTDAAVHYCDRALAELELASGHTEVTQAKLRLLTDKGYLLFLLGRFSEQTAIGLEMLPLAEALDQPKPIQWAHNALAMAAMGRGQVDVALEHYGRFRDLAAGTSDRLDQAIAHSNLGVQHQYAGEFQRARAELEHAIELCREAGAEHRAINSIQRLGWVLVGEGDLSAALQQAEQARDLASRASDRWAADCFDLLGTIFSHRAAWATATASFEQALRLREHGPHAAGRVETLLGMGRVHQHTGNWSAARANFVEAHATASSMEPSPWLVAASRDLGRLYCLTGEREGLDLMASALALAETMPRSIEYGPTVLVMVELGLWRGDRGSAVSALKRLLAGGLTAEQRIEVLCALARHQSVAGDRYGAGVHAIEARTLAERLGDPRVLSVMHAATGTIAMTNGSEEQATRAFEESLAFTRIAGTPHERAMTLTAFATATWLSPERANDMLSEAHEIGHRLGVAAVPASNS
jgi:tetratricopeptide (TPR) repeat protein